MSKKHNTKHQRSTSRYKERLEARGVQSSPMADPILSDGKRAGVKR